MTAKDIEILSIQKVGREFFQSDFGIINDKNFVLSNVNKFDILNDSPWPEQPLEMLEAAAGTLIILHGQLPHYSAANRSSRSRQAFTLHLVDKLCDYPQDNWLQTDLV